MLWGENVNVLVSAAGPAPRFTQEEKNPKETFSSNRKKEERTNSGCLSGCKISPWLPSSLLSKKPSSSRSRKSCCAKPNCKSRSRCRHSPPWGAGPHCFDLIYRVAIFITLGGFHRTRPVKTLCWKTDYSGPISFLHGTHVSPLETHTKLLRSDILVASHED